MRQTIDYPNPELSPSVSPESFASAEAAAGNHDNSQTYIGTELSDTREVQSAISIAKSELERLKAAEGSLLLGVEEDKLEHLEDSIYRLNNEQVNRLNEKAQQELKRLAEDLREIRAKFVEEFIEDSTKEIVDHFESSLSEAKNGDEAKELLELKVRHALRISLEEYIDTGNMQDFKDIIVELEFAKYSVGADEKKFITDIHISTEEIEAGLLRCAEAGVE